VIHTCQDCGLIHDHAVAQAESADVAIARIQAESAVRIAELQARTDRHAVDTMSAADVAVAEVQADAVEAALADQEADEHVAQAVDAMATEISQAPPPSDSGPAPIVVAQDTVTDVPAPPHVEEHHEEPPPKKRGLGLWG
jgi:hypothetical protein